MDPIAADPAALTQGFGLVPSALFGFLLGTVNALAALLIARLALRQQQQTFTVMVLGGLGLRLMAVVLFVLVVVLLVPVHTTAFVLGLFAAFVLGLILEAAMLLTGRPLSPSRG